VSARTANIIDVRVRWLAAIGLCGCSLLTDLTDLTGLGSPDASPDGTIADATDDVTDASDASDASIADGDAASCSDAGPPIVLGSANSVAVNVSLDASVDLGQNVAANDVIVLAAKINNVSSVSVSAITDTQNNTYSYPMPFKTGGFTFVIAYATAAQTSTTSPVITVTLASTVDGGKANSILYATKLSGLSLPPAIDVRRNGMGSNGPVTSGTGTTSFPHEIIFGFGSSNAGISEGPSFAPLTSLLGGLLEARMVDCVGTYEATAVVPDGGPWVMVMATFPGN
jgi:hypothetical protein